MPQNFLGCDRDQALLLPPSLREWLGDDHLARLVLDVVAEFDLGEFYGAYRADGHGRAAHDPAMMVALLLYSYALGQRSSRAIERRCHEDVPTRVICANQAPDHTTIARFRARHQDALARTFTQVLALCARAGLVSVGVVVLIEYDCTNRATKLIGKLARYDHFLTDGWRRTRYALTTRPSSSSPAPTRISPTPCVKPIGNSPLTPVPTATLPEPATPAAK